MSLADQRRSYREGALDDDAAGDDPLGTLARWIREATQVGDLEANAMALGTATADGVPSVRHVLCKGVDERGIRFFTSMNSRKGAELAATGHAGASFWWPTLQRSARVVGPAQPLPPDEVAAYFVTRPHGSRIGAWSSQQSQPISGRAALEAQEAAVRARFTGDEPLTPPPGWGGYEIIATEVELWHGREDRLHDRLRYTRAEPGAAWTATRLQP